MTDGTPAGTRLVRDLCPGVCGAVPADPVPLGADLFWRTDGTAAGTYPMRDRDGHTIAKPDIMTVFDGKLYFITPDLGATLWQSDGTPQGTVPLRQLEPGEHTSLAIGVAGSRLFFRAFDPATGSELWALDGR